MSSLTWVVLTGWNVIEDGSSDPAANCTCWPRTGTHPSPFQ